MSKRLLFCLLPCLAAAMPTFATQPEATPGYSAAERLLFVNEHLAAIDPPTTLHYAFRRYGSLEKPFDDSVDIALGARPDGSCCTANGEFLSHERQLRLPALDEARANPVILYFLERDVRDMQRLTQGQQAHFRKRIRMAIYSGAEVRPATWQYRGQPVQGQEIAISPYLADPSRARFEKLARKQYVFMISDVVPGGVFGIRSQVSDADASAPPLIVEELYIDGATPPRASAVAPR
jgi:hypothetical protein